MESRNTETHSTWNNIASLYEEKFMELPLYNDTYQQFCDLLSKPNASILELGCGPGNITRHILNINPKLEILATDFSKNMVSLAKKNNPKAKTKVLDCRHMDTIEKQFDGIICGFVIPYLSQSDCVKMIYDCNKLLTQEGILYLSFVPGDSKKSGFVSGSSGGRTYFYYHELTTIKEAIEANHLDIIDMIEKEYKNALNNIEKHTILLIKKR